LSLDSRQVPERYGFIDEFRQQFLGHCVHRRVIGCEPRVAEGVGPASAAIEDALKDSPFGRPQISRPDARGAAAPNGYCVMHCVIL
jgi:hypothetical protein